MVFTPVSDGWVGLFYHTYSGLDEPVEPDLSRVVQPARHCQLVAAPVCIISCGLMLVLVLGEIDISVGSMMGVLKEKHGCYGTALPQIASASPYGWNIDPGVFIGAGINGWLVAYLEVPSIIVTLGMLTALRGVTEVIMGGHVITDLPPELRFGNGHLAGNPHLPVGDRCGGPDLSVAHPSQHPWPRIYAIGSHPKAACLAGLPIARTQCLVFAWTGFSRQWPPWSVCHSYRWWMQALGWAWNYWL